MPGLTRVRAINHFPRSERRVPRFMFELARIIVSRPGKDFLLRGSTSQPSRATLNRAIKLTIIAGFHSPARMVPCLSRRGDAGRPGADPDVPAARADPTEAQGCRFRRYIVSRELCLFRTRARARDIFSNRE